MVADPIVRVAITETGWSYGLIVRLLLFKENLSPQWLQKSKPSDAGQTQLS
jgi:hypothetical protein